MESNSPLVTISQGNLQGKINTDYKGRPYYSFQGIPYAEPPLGDLRFKAPRPPKPWEGTRDATKEGSMSISTDMIKRVPVGSEDCLFLNVFTPQLPGENTNLKPVMFWIHGGAFTTGSGGSEIYGPDFLITKDVVIVTINYRLGLLGFLSVDDPECEVTGNAGLKDQVMALIWVKNNIAKFGGDPNNVTIFGESAGAVSVHFLILSPAAKGLFHAAIMQSGCALMSYPEVGALLPSLAELLELKSTDTKEVLNTLNRMSVEEILQLQEKLPLIADISIPPPLWPVVEKTATKFPFITQKPLDIIMSGKYNHVPMIVGFTSREGMLFEVNSQRIHGEVKYLTDFEGEIPHMMHITRGSDLSKSIAGKIKTFYFGQEVPSKDNANQSYLLKGDNIFVFPTYATVKHHCSTSKKPVYLYRMTVDSNLNMFKKIMGVTTAGACHADDVGYIFKTAFTPPIIPNSIEDKSLRRFTTLWTNFAKTGNPNPINKDTLLNVQWMPARPEEFHFIDIGDNLTVGLNPEGDRMAFWKELLAMSPYTSNIL